MVLMLMSLCYFYRWAASEWASAKSQLMESLGHRGSSWEGTRTPSAAIAGTHFTPSSTLQIANSPFVNRTPYRSGAKVGDFSNTPMRQLPFSVSSVQKAALSENNRAIVSDMLADHASVVRSINITSHRPSSSALLSTSTGDSPENAVGPFFHLLKSINVPNQGSSNSIVCDGMTKGDLISYRSLLEMLSSIVGEDRGNATNSGVPPGFFSSICFDTGLTYANVVEEKRRLLTSGAKRYLQNQMWENWSSIVDDAAVSGELVLPPSNPGMRMQQRLRSFVSYQARTGRLPVQCNKWMSPSGRTLRPASSHSSISTDSNTPLWAYIYHCLRVGDLDGAIHEIDSCVSAGYDHGELSALTVVKALADILSYQDEVDHRSLSNSSSHATPQTKSRKLSESDSVSLSDSMNQCRILYDKDVMNKHSEADPFKVLILNLLGLADREGITASAIPDFSFEDFLWANLWFVEMHRLVSDKVPVPMPVIVSPGLNSLSGASNVIKSRIGG